MRKGLILVALVGALFPAVALGGAAKNELKATLLGANETPKGSPTGKGTVELYMRGATKVCWEFTYSGIGTPAAAHIHKGARGKAGPVVVPLGAAFKKKGCTTASAALLRAITKTPGAYYVNVHTAEYPGGAIRGQLHADM